MYKSRYARTTTNGVTRRVRDKAALRADAIALLKTSGPLPKRRIMSTLRTAQRTIDAALAESERAGELEYFMMRSSRGRMDEFWCIAGMAPASVPTRFNASAVLAAMQAHALQLATGGRI